MTSVDWPLDLSVLPPVVELCPGCARRDVDEDLGQGMCAVCLAESAIVAPNLTRAEVEASITHLRQRRTEAQRRWRAKRRAARAA